MRASTLGLSLFIVAAGCAKKGSPPSRVSAVEAAKRESRARSLSFARMCANSMHLGAPRAPDLRYKTARIA